MKVYSDSLQAVDEKAPWSLKGSETQQGRDVFHHRKSISGEWGGGKDFMPTSDMVWESLFLLVFWKHLTEI